MTRAAPPANSPPVKNLSFEEAMGELDRIVRELESGRVDLEKSIALYERGAALKAHCEAKLKDAELRVSKIAARPDGSLTDTPFDQQERP